jgi:hypothetical protein
MTTTESKRGFGGIIMNRHLDAGMSLRDAIRLTLIDHATTKGCRFRGDAAEYIEAAIKEAACKAIEDAETSCPDKEAAESSTSAQAQSAA